MTRAVVTHVRMVAFAPGIPDAFEPPPATPDAELFAVTPLVPVFDVGLGPLLCAWPWCLCACRLAGAPYPANMRGAAQPVRLVRQEAHHPTAQAAPDVAPHGRPSPSRGPPGRSLAAPASVSRPAGGDGRALPGPPHRPVRAICSCT